MSSARRRRKSDRWHRPRGRAVDLRDVEVDALADRHALRAGAARLRRRPLLAVHHLREGARGRRLSGATWAGEQERGRQPPVADSPGERPHDVVLPEPRRRPLGPVLPVKRSVLPFLSHALPSPGKTGVAVHPPLTAEDSGVSSTGCSGQASLRHPPVPAYRCFLPALTGFAGWCRAGPDHHRSVPRAAPDLPGRGRGFSPAEADRGYRAPLAPHLARPPRRVYVEGRTREPTPRRDTSNHPERQGAPDENGPHRHRPPAPHLPPRPR